MNGLSLLALVLAALPMLLFIDNLRRYQPLGKSTEQDSLLTDEDARISANSVSVLIPARDEEATIAASASAVLASVDVELELIVLDDHSEDRTARIVEAIASLDSRLHLHEAPELPEGWCGKQHACQSLANLAKNPWLVFIDADVQLAPDAIAKMVRFMETTGADLGSGFPRQITIGWLEQLLIPLIHFILLGFLPIRRMRASAKPSLSAGCGQLFIIKTKSYEHMGGHESIRTSLHDGIKLPRAFRAAGLKTDLFDATDLASCRMYRSTGDVWFGLAKNAGEALAAPPMIVPATTLLFGGQVLPFLLVGFSLPLGLDRAQTAIAIAAMLAAWTPRWLGVVRFRQSVIGAIFHPFGVAILLMIQWYALLRDTFGRPAVWKGRAYPSPSNAASDRVQVEGAER